MSNRWWWQLKYFLMFTPIPGEDVQFDEHSFQRGWFNHQPDVLRFRNFPCKNPWIRGWD